MTNQEAIEILKDLWRYEHSDFSEEEIREALDKGIEALKNQSSLIIELEKVKAEIEDIRLSEENVDSNWCAGLKYVNNKIIDKHIAELKGEQE